MRSVLITFCLAMCILWLTAGCTVWPANPTQDPGAAPFPPSASQPTAATARPDEVLDIPYDSPGGSNNFLDLYLPTHPNKQDPATILFIHGGGWHAGDKSLSADLCRMLADAGYPTVTCNYTFSTLVSPGFPQIIFDVKAVVRWIRTEGSRRGLPQRIIAMGDSAGGHLAQMLGTTAGVATFEPLPPPPGGYRIDGVISFYGPGDLTLLITSGGDVLQTALFVGALLRETTLPQYLAASPITYVTPDDPPMALFQGGADPTVPFANAVRVMQILRSQCRYCRLFIYPDAVHSFDGFGGNSGVSQLATALIPQLLAFDPKLDLNGDGALDALDLQDLAAELLDPDGYRAAHSRCDTLDADLNGDGTVDGEDLQLAINRLVRP